MEEEGLTPVAFFLAWMMVLLFAALRRLAAAPPLCSLPLSPVLHRALENPQKLFDIEDEKRLRCLYDKRMGAEIDGAELFGDDFKGYTLRVTGGMDKQGFPMVQGVLTANRVRLLRRGTNAAGYNPKRDGERKRKSVRGCIISGEIAVVSMVVVSPGEKPIAGLTDVTIP